MIKIKYIMINNAFPILFPECISHTSIKVDGRITSAGFVKSDLSECYGKSIGLKLKSDPDDIKLIRMLLKNRDDI